MIKLQKVANDAKLSLEADHRKTFTYLTCQELIFYSV